MALPPCRAVLNSGLEMWPHGEGRKGLLIAGMGSGEALPAEAPGLGRGMPTAPPDHPSEDGSAFGQGLSRLCCPGGFHGSSVLIALRGCAELNVRSGRLGALAQRVLTDVRQPPRSLEMKCRKSTFLLFGINLSADFYEASF